MKSKKCKICGKEFIPKKSDREVYCSRECRLQYNREQKKAREQKRKAEKGERRAICPICGTEFTPVSTQKYCSERCKKDAVNLRNRQRTAKYAEQRATHRFYKVDFAISKAFDIEEEMRAKGLRYADYQKAQTLQMVREGRM